MLDVKICSCGTLLFFNSHIFNSIIKNNKELAIICKNCGEVTIIGANMTIKNNQKPSFSVYSFKLQGNVNSYHNEHKNGLLTISTADSVIMNTLCEADSFNPNTVGFADYNSKNESQFDDDEYNIYRTQVNMKALINKLSNTQIQALIKYSVPNLIWTEVEDELIARNISIPSTIENGVVLYEL